MLFRMITLFLGKVLFLSTVSFAADRDAKHRGLYERPRAGKFFREDRANEGFTKEPPLEIVVQAGSKIPDMVWETKDFEDASKIEIIFTSKPRRGGEEVVAAKLYKEQWAFSKRCFVKDPATLVFTRKALKQDEGKYTLIIHMPSNHLERSSVRLIILGGVVFTKEPPETIYLNTGSKIPDLVWKHNGTNDNVTMAINIRYADGVVTPIAVKNYGNPWEMSPSIKMKGQATLVFLNPFLNFTAFVLWVDMVLSSPQGRLQSTVKIIERGIGFTQKPRSIIKVKAGSRIPDLVWKHNGSDVLITKRVTFRSFGNGSSEKVLAKKKPNFHYWEQKDSRTHVKDQATLTFKYNASENDEGVYAMELDSSFTLPQDRLSPVSLIVFGGVVFIKQPPKTIIVDTGSKIPHLVWRHNGSDRQVVMKVSMDIKNNTPALLAEKNHNTSWKIYFPGIKMKEQATLVFLRPTTGYFESSITVDLQGPHSYVTSSVDIIVRGIGFTQKPNDTINVKYGSKIPDLVWRLNASEINDIDRIMIDFSSFGNEFDSTLIASKFSKAPWYITSSQIYIKDEFTLGFIKNASESNNGTYSILLQGQFVLQDKSAATITVTGAPPKPSTVKSGQTTKQPTLITDILYDDKKNAFPKGLVAVSVLVPAIILLSCTMFVLYLWRKRQETKRQGQIYRRYDDDDTCQDELLWDVFISYSGKDFSWVKNLNETLEQPPFNLKVCLHQRDWEIGRPLVDNMADSVYCSEKTLVVISKNYLDSHFCMQELHIALHKEMESKRERNKATVVPIVIDDVSLKNLPKVLRQRSFLDFSNEEQRKYLEKKLLKVMPKPGLQNQGNKCYEMGESSTARV